MSDKFVMSSRQAAELDHAFERNGWCPEDVKWLSAGTVLTDIRSVRLGVAEIKVLEYVIDCDAAPFTPSGLKVEEHKKSGAFKWDTSPQVKLYLSQFQKKGVIGGNKLRKKLAGKPVLNANVLDYLLAHPHLIPEEWKDKYVFFWGTIYRYSGGGLCVRYLGGDGDEWGWSCGWLDCGWSGLSPAALRAS